MKVLYFNIMSGECVPAFTSIPQYKATITGSKIHKIEACFSIPNIAELGYEWFLEQARKDNEDWTNRHPHLMKSLKKLALKQSLRHPFKFSNFEPDCHRYPYVLVWMNGKEYDDAHFVDI